MPIVFDPQTDPVYKEGMEYGLQLGLQRGLQQGLQQGIRKAKLEDAIILIKEFNLPIDVVSKKLNISIEELKEYIYQKR